MTIRVTPEQAAEAVRILHRLSESILEQDGNLAILGPIAVKQIEDWRRSVSAISEAIE